MLRAARRIRSQHVHHALHSVQTRLYSPVQSSHRRIHPSCPRRVAVRFQHLALSSNHVPRVSDGSYSPPVPQSPPITPSNQSDNPRRPIHSHPPKITRHYPPDLIHAVDAHLHGTKPVRDAVLSRISSCHLRNHFADRETARSLAEDMASSPHPSRALSVMLMAHAIGCRFKPNHFESVIYHLSIHHHWSLIPPLVSTARHQCGKTTARLLNWKMRAFIECHRFANLVHVLNEFTREAVLPNRRTYHLVLSGHLRNRDLISAKRALDTMEAAGFPPDASTHALIVTVHRSLGLDPQVHARAFQALTHVDARTSTRVLNSIVQQFMDIGDEPSAVDYIRYFSPPTSTGHATQAHGDGIIEVDGVPLASHSQHAADHADRLQIAPDAATFTILINYLAQQRHLRRLHKVLDRMLEANVKPDSGVVSALIRAYCLSGHDEMAVSLFAAMLRSEADAHSISTSLRVKLVPHLPLNVKGISLSVHVFNAILGRAMEIRGLNGARFIFRLMHHNGILPNAITTEVFLDYLDRTENVKPRQLIRILRSMSPATHGPTIRQLHVVLRNFLRRQKYLVQGSGWNVTASMFSPTREFNPTCSSSPALLTSDKLGPSGGLGFPRHLNSWLRPVFLALSRKAVRCDRATLSMRLKQEAILDPSLETAKAVFRHMVEQGMHPNQYHYSALMTGYARAGDMIGAEQIVRSANQAGLKPDVVMYTVLISGYGRQGKPQLALKTFRTMISAGVAPDIPAIDALAHAYFAVGAYTLARRVLLRLWPLVKPLPHGLERATLKRLARVFRSLGDSRVVRKEPLTTAEQRLLHWKIRGFLREWRRLQRLQKRTPHFLSAASKRCAL